MEFRDIVITSPVTAADEEWIAALRGHRDPPAPFAAPVPVLRPIPCHPTHPII